MQLRKQRNSSPEIFFSDNKYEFGISGNYFRDVDARAGEDGYEREKCVRDIKLRWIERYSDRRQIIRGKFRFHPEVFQDFFRDVGGANHI